MILILSLGLLCLNSGCSRLDMAYRWADVYIASKVDDYFDISSEQKKELKKSLKKDLAEVKSDVLPTWIENLKKIEKEVNAESINQEQVAAYFSAFMKDIEEINSHFTNTAVNFIATTSPKQRDNFVKAFDKKNSDDLAKINSPSKLREQYKDKYIDWMEMFIGSMTSDQKSLLEKHLATAPFPAVLKIKNKEYIFAQHLAGNRSQDDLQNFVKEFCAHPKSFDMPEYTAAVEAYKKNLQKFVVDVFGTLTPKQKSALKENLAEKIGQLETIVNRS